MKCVDNNRASTVMSAFMNAVYVHGLPERIRTDLGGENVEVWRFMVEQHGSVRAIVTGSSAHNERIYRTSVSFTPAHVHTAFLFLSTENKLLQSSATSNSRQPGDA